MKTSKASKRTRGRRRFKTKPSKSTLSPSDCDTMKKREAKPLTEEELKAIHQRGKLTEEQIEAAHQRALFEKLVEQHRVHCGDGVSIRNVTPSAPERRTFSTFC